MASNGAPGLDFKQFKRRIAIEPLNDAQQAMLQTRLELLEGFVTCAETPDLLLTSHEKKPNYGNTKRDKEAERNWYANQDAKARAAMSKSDIWSFHPGSLTIIDLSCPFVDESAACALFSICLTLFMEGRTKSGRIVALDEAHKVNQALP